MRRLASILAVALALPPPPLRAGSPAPAEPPTIAVTAAEVAVDFVVRDKKGRIVRDLKPGELEVYEDGVRQDVALFQRVTTSPVEEAPAATPAATGAETTPLPPPPAPDVEREAVLALVFDRLSPVARHNAYEAALAWLKRPAVRGREVGVFRIDQGLEQLQTFTDDRGPVMQALEDVRDTVPTAFRSGEDRERLRTLRQQIALLEGRVVSASGPQSAAESGASLVVPEARRSRSGAGQELARRQLASEYAMLQALETLERDQQGLATTNGLLALVNGLRTLPGRKAVVLFSEGLVLPDRVLGTLGSVISEANRGGVSFYAADAGGLRTTSAADEARREVVTTADAIAGATESDTTLSSRFGMTRLLERNEDVLRFDPASGLGALARETGGFLIHDTNDVSLGLEKVEEELGSYYLVSYAPKNETWDGRYRKIDVRARRSGLTVQARRGYYAVRTPTPTPVLDYEAPALARLEQAPQARDLPVRVRALHFPAEDGDSVVAIAAELPSATPSLRPDKDSGELHQDFTLMALVHDASGRIVHKASHRYVLSWPRSKADDVKRGRILFERDAVLPPGRYTVEVVAYDAQAGTAGVDRATLAAPSPARGDLRVSSLLLVGHAEPHATLDPGPLHYQGLQLFPSFGEAVPAGPGKPLAFVFTVRPGDQPPRDATVELLRGNEAVRHAAVPLPAPDATGQLRVVSGLPVDGVGPGAYTLRLVLSDGRSLETRTVEVTLAP